MAINSQEDLNQLARLTGAFEEDSIVIDGEYIAYTDYDGAVDGDDVGSSVGDLSFFFSLTRGTAKNGW